MRDPWKLLALVLAIVWIGLAGLLSPGGSTATAKGLDERSLGPSSTETAHIGKEAFRSETPTRMETESNAAAIDLLVRVADPEGELLNGGVGIQIADGTRAAAQRVGSAVLFPGLVPGSVRIDASAKGHYDRNETVEILASPTEQYHEIVLEPSANIAVRYFSPDGRRLFTVLKESDEMLEAFVGIPSIYATTGEAMPSLPLSADGGEFRSPHATWRGADFTADGLAPDGYLSLRSRPPLALHLLLGHQLLGVHLLESAVTELELIVDPVSVLAMLANIHVELVNSSTGQPPEKATAYLQGARTWLGLKRLGTSATFERHGVLPGVYQLTAMAGELRLQRQVVLTAGETLDLGELRFEANHPFECRVQGPDGAPLARARLLFWNPADHPRWISFWNDSGATSDEQGLARHPGLGRGDWIITILPPSGSDLAPAQSRASVPSGVPSQVRLARSRKVLLRSEASSAIGRNVVLLVDGVAPLQPISESELPTQVALGPGLHTWLLVDAGGLQLARGEFTVPSDGLEPIVEVRLP